MNLSIITINDIVIRKDQKGRYCLNDLHKASGGEKRHRPQYWLELKKTQELIQALIEEDTKAGIPASEQVQPVTTIRGGSNRGTYGVEDLIHNYTMWINPRFKVRVNYALKERNKQGQEAFGNYHTMDNYHNNYKDIYNDSYNILNQQELPSSCPRYAQEQHSCFQGTKEFQSELLLKLKDIATAIRELTESIKNNQQQPQPEYNTQIDPKTLQFLNAWWDCFGNQEITANDLQQMINNGQCEALTQAANHLFGDTNITNSKLQDALQEFHIINIGKDRNGVM